SGNTVGGTAAGAGNILSGNRICGVRIESDADRNVVQGNWIGTDATGTRALPNIAGVCINGANNTVGGTTAGAGNTISGNRDTGISVGPGAPANVFQGNRIGTDATGTKALANVTGVEISYYADGNTIGGTAAGAGNTISGNTSQGVLISGTAEYYEGDWV